MNTSMVLSRFRIQHALLLAVVGLLGMALLSWYQPSQMTLEPNLTPTTTEDGIPGMGFERSMPMQLMIPKLGLEAFFEGPLGLNDDGTMEVPRSYDDLGWYQYGPTPGELGPAVIVGHVDSYAGPAIFYQLGQLELGDVIQVAREDGSVAEFVVTEMGRYGQSADDFPTAKVYGDLPYAGLRLITCSGYFDRGTQRYSHNLVVYARLTQ